MTQVFNCISEFKTYRNKLDGSIGFVPSLGGLHAGHLSLIEKSQEQNSQTVVSIFLNPTQFNDKNDLKNYPSTWSKDLSILQSLKVDAILKPNIVDIYPDDYSFIIKENEMSPHLCGASRPGHFDGVLTVVAKLLNIVKADNAYFGEKDYQQYLLIQKLTEALFINTTIVPCPIVRDENGLALSSRNQLLTPEQFKIAPLLYKTISKDISLNEMQTLLTNAGFKIDYLKEIWGRRFAAAHLGDVRLIDNVKI